jgi:hypothetical protein
MEIHTVCGTGRVELRELRSKSGISTHAYLHETHCAGHKLAVLPYRPVPGFVALEVLLQHEVVVPWDTRQLVSSITGSVENFDPDAPVTRRADFVVAAALAELQARTGYVAEAHELFSLGACFCNQLTDSKFALFALDVSRKEPVAALCTMSQTEGAAKCRWHVNLDEAVDPLAHIMHYRLMRHLISDLMAAGG